MKNKAPKETATQKEKSKAQDAFERGHPDGLRPTAVRNYGDFGRDVIVDSGYRENQPLDNLRGVEMQQDNIPGISKRQELLNKKNGVSNASKNAPSAENQVNNIRR